MNVSKLIQPLYNTTKEYHSEIIDKFSEKLAFIDKIVYNDYKKYMFI